MAIERGKSFTDVANAKPTAEVRQLEITLDFCYAVQECLDSEGITRKELAERLGETPSAVTRILSGEANITIKTIAKFMTVLDGLNVAIASTPIAQNAETERYVIDRDEKKTERPWSVGAIRHFEEVA